MCFRPADASAPQGVICPECGKKVNAVAGVMAKECPFCGEELPEASAMPAGAPAAPAAPGAPGAPAAPGVPGAPAAPKAPGVV